MDVGDALLGSGVGALLSLFKTDPEKYSRLASYAFVPDSAVKGKRLLEEAKNSSQPQAYRGRALYKFLNSVDKTNAKIIESYAYRHAAIAAELNGDKSAAKNYLQKHDLLG